jgi:glutathione synthase/RimK-type ligase-like ATP-grasp enzyme
MSAPNIFIVTCERWPGVSGSDYAYAKALEERGAVVALFPWNDPPPNAACADLMVLRSNWDYHDHQVEFSAWLRSLDAQGRRVANDPLLVLSYADKRAFIALGDRGIPMPATTAVPFGYSAVAQVLRERGWDSAVLKPVHGASGRGVQTVTRAGVADVLAVIEEDVGRRDLLVQEFLPEIAEGEVQMIFFGGKFSHAVRKVPVLGEYRTNVKFKPAVEVFEPPISIIQQAEAILRVLNTTPLYARVDGVLRGGIFVLIELELNEPDLWLDKVDPSHAGDFAEKTLRLVGRR